MRGECGTHEINRNADLDELADSIAFRSMVDIKLVVQRRTIQIAPERRLRGPCIWIFIQETIVLDELRADLEWLGRGRRR